MYRDPETLLSNPPKAKPIYANCELRIADVFTKVTGNSVNLVNSDDFDAFLSIIENPPEPNAKLIELMRSGS